MRKNLKYNTLLILMIAALSWSCRDKKEIEPTALLEPNELTNKWILNVMSEVYYWVSDLGKPIDMKSDPEDFFEALLYRPTDRFSIIYPDYQELINALSGISLEAGYEIQLYRASASSNAVIAEISYIKTQEIPFLRRKIGIIFQDFQLFGDRTVAENLIFVMKATGWKDSQKIKNRMTEVLLLVGLDDAMTKMPHQLSGGEQQRVVIARALINNPSILLADEPTGNLDPEVADGIFKLFQEINKKGTAILMATHNHELLRKYPYRVLKCEKGELLDSQTHDVSFGYSF